MQHSTHIGVRDTLFSIADTVSKSSFLMNVCRVAVSKVSIASLISSAIALEWSRCSTGSTGNGTELFFSLFYVSIWRTRCRCARLRRLFRVRLASPGTAVPARLVAGRSTVAGAATVPPRRPAAVGRCSGSNTPFVASVRVDYGRHRRVRGDGVKCHDVEQTAPAGYKQSLHAECPGACQADTAPLASRLRDQDQRREQKAGHSPRGLASVEQRIAGRGDHDEETPESFDGSPLTGPFVAEGVTHDHLSELGDGPRRQRTRQRLRCQCCACRVERRTSRSNTLAVNGVRGVERRVTLARSAGPTSVLKSTVIASSAAASAMMHSAGLRDSARDKSKSHVN